MRRAREPPERCRPKADIERYRPSAGTDLPPGELPTVFDRSQQVAATDPEDIRVQPATLTVIGGNSAASRHSHVAARLIFGSCWAQRINRLSWFPRPAERMDLLGGLPAAF